MSNILNIRIDADFSQEDTLKKLLKDKKNLYYIYGKEISKQSKKEHFHIVLKTDYHIDTARRKIKKAFNFTKSSEYYVKAVKDLIKTIAYTIKDNNYESNWDDNDQLEQALDYKDKIQVELSLKTLKEKLLYYLGNHEEKKYWHLNTDLLEQILKWFKQKELNYPAQHWLKNVMVTFWMDNKTDFSFQNIQSLYNIRDPFIDPQKNI